MELVYTLALMAATIIPFELPLPKVLPTIEGNVDYRTLRDQLLQINHMLNSGLEARMMEVDLEQWLKGRPGVSAKAQQNRQRHCRRALRCNIARLLLKEDYRGFARRQADSPLLQFFCGIAELDRVRVPSKSALQRYDTWWSEEHVRQLVIQLLQTGAQQPEKLQLPEAVDLETCFLDTTCVAANIHYPVDWVLFRDATRTLMKAVKLIREQGLKHRMEAPEVFMTRINRLCIEMTHTRAKQDSKRHCKITLRKMDRVVGTVAAHARCYRKLLDEKWDQTQWTRPQAEQVLRRIDQVLEQLPQARKQARQRIISGQVVENKDKILSLYEREVRVIVRKKAGAEVEFGNTMLLGENPQGLILDWELFKETAPADSRLQELSRQRMKGAFGPVLKNVGGDRGFHSKANQKALAKDGIYDGVCPRSPQELKERGRSWKFKKLQRRRAQTEGRVAIIKNVFLGRPLRSKGYEHRALSVTWTVLTHDLWVMARFTIAAREAARAAQKAAATAA
jgi:IS5 family transposase